MRFKDLSIGAKFEFDPWITVNGEPFRCTGLATGPWVKLSPRRYQSMRDKGKHRVGSVNTKVIELTTLDSEDL